MSIGITGFPFTITVPRLIGLFALAVVLPFVVLLANNLYDNLAEDYADAYRIADLLAKGTVHDTERFIAVTKARVVYLASRPDVRALDPRRCDPFMKAALPLLPYVTNVLTVDAEGHIVCSAIPISKQTPRTVRPQYWLDAMRHSNRIVVGKAVLGSVTKKWVSTIAQPIFDKSNRFAGAVGIAVELASYRPLNGLDSDVDKTKNSTIRIISREGIVIASMDEDDKWIGRDVRDHALVKTIIARGEGTARIAGLDGVERLTAFRPVPGTDWLAVAGVSSEYAYAQFYRRLKTALLSVAGAILIAIISGLWIGRRVTRPLRTLSAVAQEVANGNLECRAAVTGPTDLASVTRQFNRMLEAQSTATRDLRQSEAQMRVLLDNSPTALALLDGELRYLAASRRWLDDFKLDGMNLIGRSHLEVFPELPERWKEVLRRCLAGASESAEQDEYTYANGLHDWMRWAVLPWYRSNGEIGGVVIFCERITERVRAQTMLAASRSVLDAIARGQTLPAVLDLLVRLFEAQAHDLICSILLIDEDGHRVRHGAAPSLPGEFMRAIEGGEIGPLAASCGTAAFRRERVIVEDITSDPLWSDCRDLALRHGLRACWSTPVFDDAGRLLATFACYYRMARGPSPNHIQLVDTAINLASIAISNSRREHSLKNANAEMRILARRLLEAEATERRRLAAELHDRVGPNLSSLGLNLQLLRLEMPAAAVTKASKRFADAQRLIEQTTNELRGIMQDLRPSELDDFGIKAALEFFAQQTGQRAGFSVQMNDGDLPLLAVAVETELYWIGREAIANAAKHAAPTQLTIYLGIVDDQLVMSITDNGSGMLPEQIEGTRGLRSMRERALAIGAHLTVKLPPGGGTQITVTLDNTLAAVQAE
jgi:PAS domain S-box-containing protein